MKTTANDTEHAPEFVLPPELLGVSPRTAAAAELARHAAASDDSALVIAENGLSAERVARAIHSGGTRAGRPFVAVDCGAGDASSVTTELFGSVNDRRLELEGVAASSALVRVGDGTLFLANAGELPATAQLRLARVLRDGEVRVGGDTLTLGARIVAGAPVEIDRDVEERRFRAELHRRLQRIRIEVPPLRERGEDLPQIIHAVLEASCRRAGTRRTLAPAAITALSALPWPGNLDELGRMMDRLVERVSSGTIRQEDVLAELQFTPRRAAPRPHLASLREARLAFEREYIATVLQEHGWSMSAAARTLGIERANLYRKTRQLGIARVKRTRVS
jgi:DNA-binding NtrC family response regulator